MTGRVRTGFVLALVLLITIITCGCADTNRVGTPVPGTPPAAPDLTNQNSPQAAVFTGSSSTTILREPPVTVGVRRVAGGFTAPMTVVSPHDGSGRLFLVDQTGIIWIFFMNGTVVDTPFLDLRDRMVALSRVYDERGLLSLAFHPRFATNGRVFVYYSAPLRAGADPSWSCTNRLSEFHLLPGSEDRVDLSSERVLLEIDKPSENHNGGPLLFGPDDGYLYLPLGDGGGADDTGPGHTAGTGNAQDLTKLFGKVIRIDIDTASPGKAYGIPADNPFVGDPAVLPEIFAYGFRNPAYATFDNESHRMVIAMAGQQLFESVLILYRGGAYPWNIREGTHCFDPGNDVQPPGGTCPTESLRGQSLIGPVVELGHDTGNTVIGGVVYRGNMIPNLSGKYVFGTWSGTGLSAGNGLLLAAASPEGSTIASLPLNASSLTPVENAMWKTSKITVANHASGRINAYVRDIAENDDHEILILTNLNSGPASNPAGTGEVWEVVPADAPGLVAGS